jgi:hypothetical protein
MGYTSQSQIPHSCAWLSNTLAAGLTACPRSAWLITYEVNGNLCQDPEMCSEIETTPDGLVLQPYMFEMTIPPVYQEVTHDARGVALAEQLRQFAAMWDANLRMQGFIEAAQRQRTAALRDRAEGEVCS